MMRRLLVSSFFADVTQQIHSLRASGVISAHICVTIESEPIAFRKSAGILCIALVEGSFVVISDEYFRYSSLSPVVGERRTSGVILSGSSDSMRRFFEMIAGAMHHHTTN